MLDLRSRLENYIIILSRLLYINDFIALLHFQPTLRSIVIK